LGLKEKNIQGIRRDEMVKLRKRNGTTKKYTRQKRNRSKKKVNEVCECQRN